MKGWYVIVVFNAYEAVGDGTFDETRFYLRSLNDSEINQLYLHPDGKTETKITDVKVTLKDPTDVYPFDTMFKTTSTEFTISSSTDFVQPAKTIISKTRMLRKALLLML